MYIYIYIYIYIMRMGLNWPIVRKDGWCYGVLVGKKEKDIYYYSNVSYVVQWYY